MKVSALQVTVKLAGRTNTQAAKQLHSDKAKDIYWLNQMSPSNHVFAFRQCPRYEQTNQRFCI